MSNYIRALILGPFLVSTKFVIFLTFVVFVYTGGTLTAEKVFVTISLYQAVRLSTTLFIPFAIQFISETRVTIKRLEVSSCIFGCRVSQIRDTPLYLNFWCPLYNIYDGFNFMAIKKIWLLCKWSIKWPTSDQWSVNQVKFQLMFVNKVKSQSSEGPEYLIPFWLMVPG